MASQNETTIDDEHLGDDAPPTIEDDLAKEFKQKGDTHFREK